jgi:hypothetical protein
MNRELALRLCHRRLIDPARRLGLAVAVGGPIGGAGLLRDSVVLSCASWCQLQRAPFGK